MNVFVVIDPDGNECCATLSEDGVKNMVCDLVEMRWFELEKIGYKVEPRKLAPVEAVVVDMPSQRVLDGAYHDVSIGQMSSATADWIDSILASITETAEKEG